MNAVSGEAGKITSHIAQNHPLSTISPQTLVKQRLFFSLYSLYQEAESATFDTRLVKRKR